MFHLLNAMVIQGSPSDLLIEFVPLPGPSECTSSLLPTTYNQMPIKLPPNCWEIVLALVKNLSDPEAAEADNTNCSSYPMRF